MTETHKPGAAAWLLLLFFLAVWFYALGARTLVPTDEARYAEMAREMVATGDWVTPRLNGIKYFEKPPLQTWMNALTFSTFGLGEWQARLWTGLCGLLGIFLTAFAGARVFDARVGLNAGLVLGSSLLWAALGHFNSLDMGLAAMMTVALCGLLLGQRPQAATREQRNWMLVCWAGMALAVMSKGLIGVVLPGAVLVLYTLASRDWAIWKRLHFGAGLLVFLALTVPWFVLVSLQNPEFARFFFIHEHFERFLSKVHRREGAWYYFVPVLVAGIIPWLGVLPQSLWAAKREASPGFQPKKLLLVWSAFIFIFFSVSNSKLPSYILPIFPALALLIACRLGRISSRALVLNAVFLAALGVTGLAFVHKVPSLPDNAFDQALYRAYQPWLLASCVIALAGGVLAALLVRRYRQGSIVTLAATAFLAGQVGMLGHEPLGRYKAGLDHVSSIRSELAPDTALYAVGAYEQALPFYLGRTFTLVGQTDEMAFGLEHEPYRWIPDYPAFVKKWREDSAAGKKDIGIFHPAIWAEMKKAGLPARIIAQDPRRIIATNDPKNKSAP